MKLTEEQYKWIKASTPREGTSSSEKAHWICGAQEAIEKFGGIQWNKYPEVKPIKEAKYLAYDLQGTIMVLTWLPRMHGSVVMWSVVTHWAEINLPNQ